LSKGEPNFISEGGSDSRYPAALSTHLPNLTNQLADGLDSWWVKQKLKVI